MDNRGEGRGRRCSQIALTARATLHKDPPQAQTIPIVMRFSRSDNNSSKWESELPSVPNAIMYTLPLKLPHQCGNFRFERGLKIYAVTSLVWPFETRAPILRCKNNDIFLKSAILFFFRKNYSSLIEVKVRITSTPITMQIVYDVYIVRCSWVSHYTFYFEN